MCCATCEQFVTLLPGKRVEVPEFIQRTYWRLVAQIHCEAVYSSIKLNEIG